MRLFIASFIAAVLFHGHAQAAQENLYHCQVMSVVRGNPTVVGDMTVNAYSTNVKIVYLNRNRDAAVCAGVDPRNRATLICGFSLEDNFVRFVRVDRNPIGAPVFMALTKDARGTEALRPISYAATSVGSRDLHAILPYSESGTQWQISCSRSGRPEERR